MILGGSEMERRERYVAKRIALTSGIEEIERILEQRSTFSLRHGWWRL